MKILSALIFFGINVLFFPPASAETPTITWAFSATENLSEKFRSILINDKHPLFQILQNQLTEYRHDYFFGTVTRIENELKNKRRTCYPASTGLEQRVAYAYLTPITILPPPLVITRRDVAEKYQSKDKTISLT